MGKSRDKSSLDALRRSLDASASQYARWGTIPFGLPTIDAALPGGGLARGALHEVASRGADIEHGAGAALFVAGILARASTARNGMGGNTSTPAAAEPGYVLWVLHQPDLFAPALAGVGLHPDRVIYAQADRPAEVLLAMEDALRHHGLVGVVGELSGRFTLTASRRLQLASEAIGVPAFVLRRSRRHNDPELAEPCAAVSRWRVGAIPSPPALPHAPDVPGLSRPRWRLELMRCRGAEAKSWIVEACDAQGRLGLPTEFSDRPAQARPPSPLSSGDEGTNRRRGAAAR